MKSEKKSLFLVIISGIVFGIMPSAVTFCYSQGANKFLVLLFRYLTLTVILFPSVAKQKNTWALYQKNWLKFLVLSLAGVCTPILLYSAYGFLPTGVVTTIHFLHPAVVTLACVLVFHEKLSKTKLLCLTFCISGMFLMLDTSEQALNTIGILIAVASCLTWATYIVLLDKLDFQDATSIQIVFCVSLNGIILALITALLSGELAVTISAFGWFALVGISIFISVCGVLFFAVGVRGTNAQISSIASTLEPITSLLVGALILKERIAWLSAVGAVLIIAAVVLLSAFDKKE